MLQTEDYERAVKSYFRYCEKNNFHYQQPSEGLSELKGNLVVLNNANGILATFNFRKSRLYVRK